jgi:hypothetical protein
MIGLRKVEAALKLEDQECIKLGAELAVMVEVGEFITPRKEFADA